MKKRNITEKQKIDGWVKFIEHMIKFYTSDIQREICDGIDYDYIDSIDNSVDNISVLITLYRDVVFDYEEVNWPMYARLKHMRNDLGERIHEISIDEDVLDAMLYDAFVKDADKLPF